MPGQATTSKWTFHVLRRAAGNPAGKSRRDSFAIDAPDQVSVSDALRQLQERPITSDGRQVAPVVWGSACADKQCGQCTMLINGIARVACRTTLAAVSPKKKTITLAPLSKGLLVEDLVVDRKWPSLPITSAGPARVEEVERTTLRRCIDCGACYEACPQTGPNRPFVGPRELVRARDAYVAGNTETKAAILDELTNVGGLAHCGAAQNCVEVCPVELPVFEAIVALSRETWRWRR